jgi:cell division protein FtsA
VIEPRVTELYELVQAELRRSGYEELLSSGIVLTGGSAVMRGMVELGEDVFHMPVRIGIPSTRGLADVVRTRATPPRWACCHGRPGAEEARHPGRDRRATFKQVLGDMKSWFEKNF